VPTKFKIFDVRRVPSAEPARVGKWDKLVMYELDPMRRYIVSLPEEDFTEEKMIQAVKADMADRAQYTGKEYELP